MLSARHQLLCAIKKIQFQVSLYVLTKVLSISIGLSCSLQLENSDLKIALDAASYVEDIIEQLRMNSANEFMKLFETVEKPCEQIGISVFHFPGNLTANKLEIIFQLKMSSSTFYGQFVYHFLTHFCFSFVKDSHHIILF